MLKTENGRASEMVGGERVSLNEWVVDHSSMVTPEDLLTFVYLEEFEDEWKQLHADDNDELSLWALEVAIMMAPDGPSVIPGTGGLRKLRWSQPGGGKRSGLRVCYAYFPEFNTVLMVVVYNKVRKGDIQESDKKSIKRVLAYIESLLEEKS